MRNNTFSLTNRTGSVRVVIHASACLVLSGPSRYGDIVRRVRTIISAYKYHKICRFSFNRLRIKIPVAGGLPQSETRKSSMQMSPKGSPIQVPPRIPSTTNRLSCDGRRNCSTSCQSRSVASKKKQ